MKNAIIVSSSPDAQAYVECDCLGHGLHMAYYKEEYGGDLHISLYEMNPYHRRTTLKNKLRMIWRIVTKGSPYSDQITITETDRDYKVSQLIAWLQSLDLPKKVNT